MKKKIVIFLMMVMFLSLNIFNAAASTLSESNDAGDVTDQMIPLEDEVIITSQDISELEDARNYLESLEGKQALDEVIAFVEENEEATYNDLAEILSGSIFGPVSVSGTCTESPNFGGAFRFKNGFQVFSPRVKLDSGYVRVWGEREDAPCIVTMIYFIGYWCVSPSNSYDRVSMIGFGLGIDVNNQNTLQSESVIQNDLNPDIADPASSTTVTNNPLSTGQTTSTTTQCGLCGSSPIETESTSTNAQTQPLTN